MLCGSSTSAVTVWFSCWDGPQHPQHPSLFTAAKSPSAQLMEQVVQLKSLSDTIERLKVGHPTFPPRLPTLSSLGWPWGEPGTGGVSLDLLHAEAHWGAGGREGDFSPKCLSGILFRLVNHQCWFFRMRGCSFCQLDQERAECLLEVS